MTTRIARSVLRLFHANDIAGSRDDARPARRFVGAALLRATLSSCRIVTAHVAFA